MQLIREFTNEEIERRRDAFGKLRKLANELKINASQDQIKAWVNEGRNRESARSHDTTQ
jgi:hypothetical protein